MFASPIISAIVILVYTALAFCGGYVVSHWRSSAVIERVNGNNTVLSNANDKCAEDVANTQLAIKALKEATAQREHQADEAMKEAAPKVAERKRVITTIKALPKVALNQQCEAIIREQIEYVQSRR